MNDNFQIFIPFSKANKDKKMVYGYASTEAVDSQGEIVSKKAIAQALPDYMKFGNIREMHQPSAVGKAKSANIDDKGLFLGAKVVDKEAWEKVKEGVYNGFSIGGRKLAQVGNTIKSLKLSEISLVDRPANPDAVFTMVKFDSLGKVDEVDGISKKEMSDKEKEEMYDMFDATYILNMAKEIAYLVMAYKNMNKPTKALESALKNLKSAAKQNLGKADMLVIDALEKAITSSSMEKGMPKFAIGNRLAIDSKVNTLNSVSKFSQVNFETKEDEIRAAKNIVKASEIYGINLSPNSEVVRIAKDVGNPVPVWSNNWETDYFNKARKVLG